MSALQEQLQLARLQGQSDMNVGANTGCAGKRRERSFGCLGAAESDSAGFPREAVVGLAFGPGGGVGSTEYRVRSDWRGSRGCERRADRPAGVRVLRADRRGNRDRGGGGGYRTDVQNKALRISKKTSLIPAERIERSILLIRNHKVMLDHDLAVLYEVPTKVLVQAVKRNIGRFPPDFMFQLTKQEFAALRSQSVTSNAKTGRGGRRSAPYAFSEQGVAMLSSVLRSPRAIEVNIEIMRAFVRLRQMIASHAGLAGKLEALERKYDAQFKVVFDAIRQLMAPPAQRKTPIGFHAKHEK